MEKNTYKFKGYDWEELADCWGLEVHQGSETPFIKRDDGFFTHTPDFHEQLEKEVWVGSQLIKVTTEDDEEILLHKIREYISEHMNHGEAALDPRVKKDMVDFLTALVEQSKQTDYSYPVFEGILRLDSDFTFVSWFSLALPNMWT